MARIFISYSRKDIAIARGLAGDLEKAGFDVWWDISDLKGGDDWLRIIPAAIDSSQYFVLLLSPNSIVSEWVEREYLRALNRHMKLIPLMIEQCEVPFALANLNYIDFTAHDHDTNLKSLLTALETGFIPEPKKEMSKLPSLWAGKMLIWIGIAVILGIMLLIGILRSCGTPPIPLTPTPVIEPSSTLTQTPTPQPTLSPTAEISLTPTLTPTETATSTSTPTATITAIVTETTPPTPETFPRVELCVSTDIASLRVRTGPGTGFDALPVALSGGDCLIFSARNETSTWYMIGSPQPNPKFADFEYGWVAQSFLNIPGPVFLPVATPLPTATRTPYPTITPTFTPTLTLTPTVTFTPTDTATLIPTDTRQPTDTPEPTATP